MLMARWSAASVAAAAAWRHNHIQRRPTKSLIDAASRRLSVSTDIRVFSRLSDKLWRLLAADQLHCGVLPVITELTYATVAEVCAVHER